MTTTDLHLEKAFMYEANRFKHLTLDDASQYEILDAIQLMVVPDAWVSDLSPKIAKPSRIEPTVRKVLASEPEIYHFSSDCEWLRIQCVNIDNKHYATRLKITFAVTTGSIGKYLPVKITLSNGTHAYAIHFKAYSRKITGVRTSQSAAKKTATAISTATSTPTITPLRTGITSMSPTESHVYNDYQYITLQGQFPSEGKIEVGFSRSCNWFGLPGTCQLVDDNTLCVQVPTLAKILASTGLAVDPVGSQTTDIAVFVTLSIDRVNCPPKMLFVFRRGHRP